MPNISSMFAPIAFRTATHAGVGTGAADADGFSAHWFKPELPVGLPLNSALSI